MKLRATHKLLFAWACMFLLHGTVAFPQDTPGMKPARSMRLMLVMPFELEKNFPDTAEFPDVLVDPSSLPALHFYEGALLAIDSLAKDSIRVQIETCDTPADSAGVVKLFTHPKLKDADLVIGSFPGALAQAASFGAARHGIRLLLTQSTSPVVVNGRPDVALSAASTHTQCRKMAEFMMTHFPNANVVLVYRSMKREDELAAVFRDEITRSGATGSLKELNVSRKAIAELNALIDTTVRNVIFVISSDEAFVSPVLSLLEDRKLFGIQVTGLPTWQQFESIDFMGFSNLQVFVFDNNHIDYESIPCRNIRSQFLSRYAADPLPQAFNGFDIVYQSGKMFGLDPGNIMRRLDQWHGSSCGQIQFSGAEGSGMENQRIAVLRFSNYRLELLNRK